MKSSNQNLSERNHNLDAALEYLDMGLSVIPVMQNKKPYLPWKEYQTRRPTYEEQVAGLEQGPIATRKLQKLSVAEVEKLRAEFM